VIIAACLRTGLGTVLGSCAISRSSSESDESSTASTPKPPYLVDDLEAVSAVAAVEAATAAGFLGSMSSMRGFDLTTAPFWPTVSHPPLAFLVWSYSLRLDVLRSWTRRIVLGQ
jgi:hypothetical protein